MGRTVKFTATVTDQNGRQRPVSDTAHFDHHMVTDQEARTGIRDELRRQGTPATNIRIEEG